jgi:hypothetical protein
MGKKHERLIRNNEACVCVCVCVCVNGSLRMCV